MSDRIREMLAGYVDGELSEEQRREFEAALSNDPQLQREVDEFRKLKEVTGMARYADLPDEVWETYWESMYKKLERGFGWLFMSLGAMLLLGFGLYEFLGALFTSPDAPWWMKIGVSLLGAGAVILVVSFARESLFAFKRDRYAEVDK